jgi:TPR repeat protein
MCRLELPLGPEKLFEEATRRYHEVKGRVDRGGASWGALTKALQKEINEVVRMWRLEADQGHATAQSNLGFMYANGQGVKQDHGEAVRWYRKSADQGIAEAQANLGFMYANGQGLKQDHGEAVRWYRKSADQGNAGAQKYLGDMYASGQGVKQDHGEAVRRYRKSADQGFAEAQKNLGVMFANGHGVRQDWGKALAWFRKSAAQGHAQAKECVLLAEGELRKQQQAASRAAPERASPATPHRHTCANCGVKETAGSAVVLKPCSRCKAVVYCGKACQEKHWKAGGHRAVCK